VPFADLRHHHVVRPAKMCRLVSVGEIACWRWERGRVERSVQRVCGRQEWAREPAQSQWCVCYDGVKVCTREGGSEMGSKEKFSMRFA
jgi:hypothetical protein